MASAGFHSRPRPKMNEDSPTFLVKKAADAILCSEGQTVGMTMMALVSNAAQICNVSLSRNPCTTSWREEVGEVHGGIKRVLGMDARRDAALRMHVLLIALCHDTSTEKGRLTQSMARIARWIKSE